MLNKKSEIRGGKRWDRKKNAYWGDKEGWLDEVFEIPEVPGAGDLGPPSKGRRRKAGFSPRGRKKEGGPPLARRPDKRESTETGDTAWQGVSGRKGEEKRPIRKRNREIFKVRLGKRFSAGKEGSAPKGTPGKKTPQS